jgi:hypothetical protein
MWHMIFNSYVYIHGYLFYLDMSIMLNNDRCSCEGNAWREEANENYSSKLSYKERTSHIYTKIKRSPRAYYPRRLCLRASIIGSSQQASYKLFHISKVLSGGMRK